MRLLVLVLIVLLVLLQWRLWLGDGGYRQRQQQAAEITRLQTEVAERAERNARMQLEIDDLREGQDALEETARSDLGMIRDGEIYIQFIEPPVGEVSP